MKNKATEEIISWKSNGRPLRREPCILHPEVKHEFPENHTPFIIFEKFVNLDILVELLVNETNIYAQQYGCNFYTTSDEMKAFLGINFVMAIIKLPSISHYWDWNNTIGNTGIQNAFSRSRFQNILQNIHFASNITAERADKAYKVRPL